VNAYHNLGIQYLGKGLLEDARVQFETALRIDLAHYEAWRFLGYIKTRIEGACQ
jgi:Tfp pilus assembly protein PilF